MKVRLYTPFGLKVKTELLKRGEEQQWLIEQVHNLTGLYIDSSYMYKILCGQRNPPRIVDAICKILDIAHPASSK